MSDSVDLENRDPNNINDHLSCKFEDVLAEPEGTHSIDCVWKLSYTCFNLWKGICYKVATLLCGICIAAELGCEFAQASLLHIWCFTPCIKYMDLNCGFLKKVWAQCVTCACEPCCQTCSLFFSAFKKS
ncbi:caveolin-3-like [Ruditapes philippinarum]|uniref:caveolin-3-like n=1 Tax=Ruditapes philippinarum TaxID=129788 RepID=UPI00295AC7F2|nr:caveolin-3-like [Ruditapes philippinarum]